MADARSNQARRWRHGKAVRGWLRRRVRHPDGVGRRGHLARHALSSAARGSKTAASVRIVGGQREFATVKMLLAVCAVLAFLPAGSWAKSSDTTALAPPDRAAASDLDAVEDAIDQIDAALKASSLGDLELKDEQARVSALQTRIAADLAELTPNLNATDSRLAQLGS